MLFHGRKSTDFVLQTNYRALSYLKKRDMEGIFLKFLESKDNIADQTLIIRLKIGSGLKKS